MKQRIFNKGKGWYISASNYKDKEDKAYMNVHFAKCEEPTYQKAGDNEFTFADIDIIEQKYGAYKGKITLTVFKWEYTERKDNGLTEVEEQNGKYAESHNLDLSPDDLPFY